MEYKNYTVSILGLTKGSKDTIATTEEDAISNVVVRMCTENRGLLYGKIKLYTRNVPLVLQEVLRIYRNGSTFVTVKEVK